MNTELLEALTILEEEKDITTVTDVNKEIVKIINKNSNILMSLSFFNISIH